VLGFPLRVTHKAPVERLFGSYVVVVIKSQLAALAALQIFRHFTPLYLLLYERADNVEVFQNGLVFSIRLDDIA
jgi:hypothetical protein